MEAADYLSQALLVRRHHLCSGAYVISLSLSLSSTSLFLCMSLFISFVFPFPFYLPEKGERERAQFHFIESTQKHPERDSFPLSPAAFLPAPPSSSLHPHHLEKGEREAVNESESESERESESESERERERERQREHSSIPPASSSCPPLHCRLELCSLLALSRSLSHLQHRGRRRSTGARGSGNPGPAQYIH
jgi:hypothetical protein